MAPVGSLVVQTPIVGKIFDLVIAAGGKFTQLRRRKASKNFGDAAGFIEILLKPFEDARNLDLPFIRQKFVQVLVRQQCAVRSAALFVELFGCIVKSLYRRSTA